VVALITNQFCVYQPLHDTNTTKITSADRLNLYSWFSHLNWEGVGEAGDVILLDEWLFENDGRFSENVNLYPAKVPEDLMGCSIKLGTEGINPYVMMTENCTQNDGNDAYTLTGLSVEIVTFVFEKMNLTAVFLPPSLSTEFDSYVQKLTELDEGLSDLLNGFFFWSLSLCRHKLMPQTLIYI